MSEFVSRAAFRRLAHDAEQRLTKSSHEGAAAELEKFVSAVLSQAVAASKFSRRRSVGRAHVLYAVRALGVQLPPELADDPFAGKLLRCNAKAPANQRKRNLMHAEISENSFRRTLKHVAKNVNAQVRIAAPARRLLHVTAEFRLLTFFSPALERRVPDSDDVTVTVLRSAMECSHAHAIEIAEIFTRLLRNVPGLLDLSTSNTLDGRLLKVAASCLGKCGEQAPLDGAPCGNAPLVRVCSKMLRGRVAHKRVSVTAPEALAQMFEFKLHSASPIGAAQPTAAAGAACGAISAS